MENINYRKESAKFGVLLMLGAIIIFILIFIYDNKYERLKIEQNIGMVKPEDTVYSISTKLIYQKGFISSKEQVLTSSLIYSSNGNFESNKKAEYDLALSIKNVYLYAMEKGSIISSSEDIDKYNLFKAKD